MGYTHYWNYKKKSPNFEQEMINVHLDIQTGLKHIDREKIVLRGGDGTGNPEFTTESIIFNGDGSVGLDHETFYFDGNPTDFEFCKTAHKPYDFVVCLCLLSLRNRLEGFDFSSDGGITEWEPVILFYQKFIGELKPEVVEDFLKLEERF